MLEGGWRGDQMVLVLVLVLVEEVEAERRQGIETGIEGLLTSD